MPCCCPAAPMRACLQAHIHYLHNDTFGNQGQPQIRDMQASLGGRAGLQGWVGGLRVVPCALRRQRLVLTSSALRHS